GGRLPRRCVADAGPQLVIGTRGATEPVNEVPVPRPAPELPGRCGLQTYLTLLAHRCPDRVVLDSAQLVRTDLACVVLFPRSQQLGRPQEAADVIGTEGWSATLRHSRTDPFRILFRAARRYPEVSPSTVRTASRIVTG